MNFAVFASGHGSNLQAIIRAVKAGRIKANLQLVVCDRADAYAIVHAQRAQITAIYINPKRFKTREAFDREVIKFLKREKIDFIALAGYMRLLSGYFVKKYKNRILNIHPSLLPSFKGARAIRDAFNYGVKVTGVTVHFVVKEVDAGPIILQKAVVVKPEDTLQTLEKRIHSVEHVLYPSAIQSFIKSTY